MEHDDKDCESDSREADGDIFEADGALSREFLLARGHCCQYGCKNCPYGFRSNAPGS
jgi:hypothetical protein